MTNSKRLAAAAQVILLGDDSLQAARDLESIILREHLGDHSLDELAYGLALYAPGLGKPYLDYEELCDLIKTHIKLA